MKGDERRKKIFNRYADNWLIVYPKYSWSANIPNQYNRAIVCPLCLSIFNETSLDQKLENPLTIEHIPPSELGGRPKILTCKKCNNESGRLLDFNIAEYLRKEPFLKLEDGAEILGTTSLRHSDGKKIDSRTIIKIDGKNSFVFNMQIPKGEWRDQQLRNIDLKLPISINLNFTTPSVKHVYIALLRIAYLLAFEKFGHAFILNDIYNGIRKQILDPNADIIDPFGAMFSKTVNAANGIYVSETPFGVKSFLIIFALKSGKESCKACVFLPPPFTDSILFYRKFKEMPLQSFTVDTREKFLDFDFLNDIKYAFTFKNAFKGPDETSTVI